MKWLFEIIVGLVKGVIDAMSREELAVLRERIAKLEVKVEELEKAP